MNKRSLKPIFLALAIFLVIIGLVTFYLVRASTQSVSNNSRVKEVVDVPNMVDDTQTPDLPVYRATRLLSCLLRIQMI